MKLTKKILRQMIQSALNEMTTSSATPGYSSKNFLNPNFPKNKIPKSKGGVEGTGKDRKTRSKPLKEKEMGSGMKKIKKIIQQELKKLERK